MAKNSSQRSTSNSKTNNKKGSERYLKYLLIGIIAVLIAYFVADNYIMQKEKYVYVEPDKFKNIPEPPFTKNGELSFVRGADSVLKTIDIEIADTPDKQLKGLMYRRSMDENRGMLIVFEKYYNNNLWMKNTMIPLDIFYADSTGKIFTIHKKTIPFSEILIPSNGPSRYAVEVNEGTAEKYGIREGDMIKFSRQ